jgi:hypothetical protein
MRTYENVRLTSKGELDKHYTAGKLLANCEYVCRYFGAMATQVTDDDWKDLETALRKVAHNKNLHVITARTGQPDFVMIGFYRGQLPVFSKPLKKRRK